MSFHVPLHDCWRPSDLAESLRMHGIQAEVDNRRVLAVIPLLEYVSIDRLFSATPEEQTRMRLGETRATVWFSSERIIDNLQVEFEFDALASQEFHPDFLSLKKAIEKCGYVSGSIRDVVQLYLPDDRSASGWIDEIELLQLRKEDLIATQDFAGAKASLQAQDVLRTKLEDKIRNLLLLGHGKQ